MLGLGCENRWLVGKASCYKDFDASADDGRKTCVGPLEVGPSSCSTGVSSWLVGSMFFNGRMLIGECGCFFETAQLE